jgi:hypothetical protein
MEHHMAEQPVIPVAYEFVAGKHFFTAATALGQGLCVAHSNLELAYAEVGKQLKVILGENHDLDLDEDVGPLASFDEFEAWLESVSGKSEHIKSKQAQVDWSAREHEPVPA